MTEAIKLYRYRVERRRVGIMEVVLTEGQFHDWYWANGGVLLSKRPATSPSKPSVEPSNTTIGTPASAKAKSKKPAKNRKSAAVAIPTISIFGDEDSEDGLYASLSGSDTPILLAIDDRDGPVHTLLMPNTVTKVLTEADLDDGD